MPIYANDVWTFQCPATNKIAVNDGKWSAYFIVSKNQSSFPFPKTYTDNNIVSQPIRFNHVELYPYDDPDSEINCYYQAVNGQIGYVSTFPYELPQFPQNCHYANKSFKDIKCTGDIENCKVTCS